MKVHQRVQKRNNQLGKLWLVFLGCTWSKWVNDDNAQSHTSIIEQAKKHKLGFVSLPHPPYSPDRWTSLDSL